MKNRILYIFFALTLFSACEDKKDNSNTIKSVISDVVTKLYEEKTPEGLQKLTNDDILNILSEEQRNVLATKYWMFDVNVPVYVYVIRDTSQQVVPFWIEKSGFSKTDLTVKNEHNTYDVWRKKFPAGRVELGINGFDDHRPTYFISVSPVNKNDKPELTNFTPEGQVVEKMEVGAFTYHDWTELILTEVPDELIGGVVLPTIRGRAGESALIGAFRKTPYPSSDKPDQIVQTWSDNPHTTLSVQWRTAPNNKVGIVRYWLQGTDKSNFKDVTAEIYQMEDVLLQNDRYINRFTARLKNLKPGTSYSYIVGNPESNIWSDTLEFKTEQAESLPFSFVYFGDTHKSPHFGELINIAYKRFPEVAFYTIGGDLVTSGLNRDDWDKEFEYMADVIKNRPLMAVPGNHDYSNGLGPLMYAGYFDFPRNGPKSVPPEYSYSFEYGDALFLMLSTMEEIDEQSAWIENQLKNTDKRWKFAMFHFPPYSLDEDKYPEIVEEWGTLFDKYHLDIVFNGHVHYYLRSKPIYANKPVKSPADGTIYVTSIAIPNRADRDMREDEFSDVFVQGEMLYQKIDINGNKLTLNAYNEKGDVIDSFEIVKR